MLILSLKSKATVNDNSTIVFTGLTSKKKGQRMRSSHLGCKILFGLAIAIIPSDAAIINPGFEDGSLTNWLSTGNAGVVGIYNTAAGAAEPLQGSYQAHVRTNGVSVDELAGFLGVTAQMVRDANGGIDATNGSAIKTGVSAVVGQSITFYWRFLEEDYVPYDDYAFVSIVAPGSSTVEKFASLATVGPGHGSTLAPWTEFTYTFTTSGTHWFGFGIVNSVDTSLDSSLFIDNISGDVNSIPVGSMPEDLTATPEPGSMSLLGAGIAALAFGRMRQRKVN